MWQVCTVPNFTYFLIQSSQQQSYEGGTVIFPGFYKGRLTHKEEGKQAQIHVTSEVAELNLDPGRA